MITLDFIFNTLRTISIFFLTLSILVIFHELGHFLVAKWNKIRVEEFGFGLPPRMFGIQIGETLYSLNWLPFGGFVRVLGEEEAQLDGVKLPESELQRAFSRKKHWQKASVVTAGVIFNFILGWAIITYFFTKGIPVPTDTVKVENVIESSPAADAGLQENDIIKKLISDSETITIDETEDISAASKKYGDTTVTLEIIRDGQIKEVQVTPRKNPPAGEGALGVSISNYEIAYYPLYQAPGRAFVESVKMTGLIFQEMGKALFKLVTFQKQEAEFAGPVGIAKITSEAAKEGIGAYLNLVAILSLNLAVLNILPFPALDGGRLVFILYEWIMKKKVNAKFEQRLNYYGFMFLLGIILLVTVSDVLKIFK